MQHKGQKVAYLRVSSAGQKLDRQEDLAEGADRVFREKESGKEGGDRPVLKEAMDWVRAGDTLAVWSIDRLARSIVDLNTIVSELRKKGVTLHFEKENMTFKPNEEADPYSEVMFNILGSFAQFERRIIRQRQVEGIALAVEAGKYRGQKPKLTAAQLEEVKAKAAAGVPKSKIGRDLGISRETVYRALSGSYMTIEEWADATRETAGAKRAKEKVNA